MGSVRGFYGRIMITSPAIRPATSRSPEETIMFKTISAALLAVSVLAAPAMAGTTKTAQAPVIKTTQAPVIKAVQVKASVLNANAKMGRHHHTHFRHHRFHKRIGALKTPHFAKVTVKHVTPPTKRG
jgi:hypothetical protein